VTAFDDDAATAVGSRRESQAGRIARLLVERIKDGQYPVGTRIPSERVLAGEFAVSRPVVREALSTVSALDIIDVQMGRGAFVTAVPADRAGAINSNLQDVVNVREIIETGALQLCQRPDVTVNSEPAETALRQLTEAVHRRGETAALDRALHTAIVQAPGSTALAELWKGLEKQIEETIRVSPHGHAMSETILGLHRRLADGVISGKTDEAIEASRHLHEQNRQFLRKLLG
jgi:GntR family transcriptional regulator, transcriptional repressor for pyruvate dehydrogenase complex